jgi:hypothetical protein
MYNSENPADLTDVDVNIPNGWIAKPRVADELRVPSVYPTVAKALK